MDFIRKYDIELEKEHYYAGEVLRGRVLIENVENLRVTCIQLFLRGKAHVEWRITRGGERRTVKEDQYFIDEKLVVWGAGDNGGGEGSISILPRGDHRFPFEFQLPTSCLPCSFESRIGTVRYYLRVIIDIPYASPPQGLKYFTVIGPYLDCMDERYRTPLSAAKQTTTKCLCCVSGPVGLEAWLEQSAYCCGEHVKVKCEVQNGSDQDVSLFCRLVQMVEFRINKGAFGLNKDVSHQVLDFHSQPVPAHTTKNFHDLYGDLRVPVMPPTMADVCKVIEINYALRIGVHLEKSGDDLQIEFPIVVATIPHLLTSGHSPELSYEPADEHVEGGIYISPEFQLGQVYDGAADHVEEVILYRPVYVCVARHGIEVVSNGHSPSSQLANDRIDGTEAVEAMCSGSASFDGRSGQQQSTTSVDGQRPYAAGASGGGRTSRGASTGGDGARKDLRHSPKRLGKEDSKHRISGPESSRPLDLRVAEAADDGQQRRPASDVVTSTVVMTSTSVTSTTMTSSTMTSTTFNNRRSSDLTEIPPSVTSTTTSVEQERIPLGHHYQQQQQQQQQHHNPSSAGAAALTIEQHRQPEDIQHKGIKHQEIQDQGTLCQGLQPQVSQFLTDPAFLPTDQIPRTISEEKRKVASTDTTKQQPKTNGTSVAPHIKTSDPITVATATIQKEGKDRTKASSSGGLPGKAGTTTPKSATEKVQDTSANDSSRIKSAADIKNPKTEQKTETTRGFDTLTSRTSEIMTTQTTTVSSDRTQNIVSTRKTELLTTEISSDGSKTLTVSEHVASHSESSRTSKDEFGSTETRGINTLGQAKRSHTDAVKSTLGKQIQSSSSSIFTTESSQLSVSPVASSIGLTESERTIVVSGSVSEKFPVDQTGRSSIIVHSVGGERLKTVSKIGSELKQKTAPQSKIATTTTQTSAKQSKPKLSREHPV